MFDSSSFSLNAFSPASWLLDEEAIEERYKPEGGGWLNVRHQGGAIKAVPAVKIRQRPIDEDAALMLCGAI